MSAMIRATVLQHPSVLWACLMLVVFILLFGGLIFLVFRKKSKIAWEHGSRLPLMENDQ